MSDYAKTVIDVSRHNGAIDWSTLLQEQPIAGVVVKLLEGRLPSIDPRARANWEALRHTDVPVSFYVFGRPDTLDTALPLKEQLADDAKREADDCFSTLKNFGFFDYPRAFTPWVDLEWIKTSAGTVLGAHKPEWIQTWIHHFEDLSGVRPGIYTGPNFWGYQVSKSFWPCYRNGDPVLAWIADYSRRANTWENRHVDLTPLAPKASSGPIITMRQWSGGGDYNFAAAPLVGSKGAIDRNWLMTDDSMRMMLLRAPEPPPKDCPESAAHASNLRQTSWHLVNLALHTLESARTIDPAVDLTPIKAFMDKPKL